MPVYIYSTQESLPLASILITHLVSNKGAVPQNDLDEYISALKFNTKSIYTVVRSTNEGRWVPAAHR